MRRLVYSVLLLFTLLHLNSNVISAAQAHRSKSLGCGAHNLSPGEYWIESPRCMNQSKTAYNCQYSIMVSPKSMISITCPRFSTSSRWCRQNYLQIHVWKYCGQNKPKDVNRRGQLKIIAFSRGHPEKIKFLCQILVSRGRIAVSTSIPVASTSISAVVTAWTQAPTTAASKSTVSAAVPTSSSTAVSVTTAAPTSTIVPATSTLETTASSAATPTSTTIPETTAAPTSYKVSETSTFETNVSSTATPSLTTDTTTVSTTTPSCQPQPPATVQCGVTNNRKARIVGGEAAEKNEFPWLAAVVPTGKSEPFCMATILNSLYVITLNVCVVVDINAVEILIHKHFYSVDDQQRRVKVERVTSYPEQLLNYPEQSETEIMRIAVVKLRTPIVFPANNSVAPVCLPAEDRTDYVGAEAIVAGWGYSENITSQPEALPKLTVTVAPDADCKAKYVYVEDAQFNATTEMCTMSVNGKDPCDVIGAPLITAGDGGKFSIIGVFYHSFCDEDDFPAIYHKITFYLPWIRRQIADGGYCTKP